MFKNPLNSRGLFRQLGYQLLRISFLLIMKILFKFKVSGLENIPRSKRVIFAGNHTSLMDGVALACAYPGRIYFLVAGSVFEAMFWGWCARRLGYITVRRQGSNKEAIKEAVGILKSGYPVGIFPEGKISCDDKLNEAKTGVAIIAKLAEADIIPFAIEGAHEAWPLKRKLPKRFPVEVRFGKPINVSTYSATQELVKDVMKDISGVKLYLEREGYLRVSPDEIIKRLINIG